MTKIFDLELFTDQSEKTASCRVVTSDGAVVVLTGKGDVVALTEYSTRKLGQRQHNVAQIEVSHLILAFSLIFVAQGDWWPAGLAGGRGRPS